MTEQPSPVRRPTAQQRVNTQNLGAAVLSIVGQWPREVRRYAETHDITFPLLTDKEREVIKNYGVYHWLGLDAYNIARPATFVIDKGLDYPIHVYWLTSV